MNATPASIAAPPHYALRMWLFFAGYFVFAGVSVPFFPVWLDSRGLTDVEIATVVAVPGLLRVFLTPFAGMFADRAPNRRFAAICFTLPAAAIFLFAWPMDSFVPLLVVAALSFTTWGLALPVGEALALTGMRRFGLDYGRMRIGGSVSYIVTNLGAGALLALLHADAIFWLMFGALVATAAVAFTLPVTPAAVRALDDRARPERPPLWSALREPAFLVVIVVAGLIQASHAMLYSFGSLFWHAEGFGGIAIGALWATAVACEILLFLWSAPLIRRFGPFGFLAIGGVAAIVRWLSFPFVPGLAGQLVLQMLHAFSFGAVYVGAQHAIARTVPEELTASAQGMLAMVAGLLMALSTLAAGPLYEAMGGSGFAVMAVLPAIALGILAMFRHVGRIEATAT